MHFLGDRENGQRAQENSTGELTMFQEKVLFFLARMYISAYKSK
jgi:hypothetical protein